MFKIFRRNNKGLVSKDLPTSNYKFTCSIPYEIPPRTISHPDGQTARLMELIGRAIEEWATEYHLENMPKKIIFEQALDAMRAIELAMNNKDQQDKEGL